MLRYFPCVRCRKTKAAGTLVDGLCEACRAAVEPEPPAVQANYYEQGWTRDARDAFERMWPGVERDCDLLGAYHAWCRAFDDAR